MPNQNLSNNTDNHDNTFKFSFIPALNGIRGIAIIGVMVSHLVLEGFVGAYIGVDLFFVLSGFLITTLLLKEYDTNGFIKLKYFYMRRIIRLLPALLFILVILMGFCYFKISVPTPLENFQDFLMSLFYIANWTRAFGLDRPDLLAHTWSLSIEEQYYILWPLTLLLLMRFVKSRNRLAAVIFVMALLSWLTRILLLAGGSTIERVYNGLDTRVDGLLIGCVLGVLVASGIIKKLNKRRLFNHVVHYFLTPLSLLVITLVVLYINWDEYRLYYWVLFLVELAGAILILDILTPGLSILRWFFNLRVLVWIGSISYGLYLWHYPIYRIVYSYQADYNLSLFLKIFLSFLMATISFYLIERPVLKLKKRYK